MEPLSKKIDAHECSCMLCVESPGESTRDLGCACMPSVEVTGDSTVEMRIWQSPFGRGGLLARGWLSSMLQSLVLLHLEMKSS